MATGLGGLWAESRHKRFTSQRGVAIDVTRMGMESPETAAKADGSYRTSILA